MTIFEKYDRNNPYNELPLLPLTEYKPDNQIFEKWGHASRALAELKSNIHRLPDPGILVNTISLQEAKSSSEIENIFTTNDELYQAIANKVKAENADPAVKEVLHYREALWAGYTDLKNKAAFDMKSLISIYQQVKSTNEGIRSPHSQVVIRRGNSDLKPGEIVYTPPRGEGIIEQKMDNLLRYLNEQIAENEDPLMKMAIAHYQFEAIHPFSDGNGRTGRILNLLYLVKSNLLSLPVLYLSNYIIRNKDDYYYHLAGVTQRRTWKPWILFMLDAIEKTSINTNHTIDLIIDQMEASLAYGKKELKWYNKEVNEAIFSQPYIKPSAIGRITGRKSRTTLTVYMKELTMKKILSAKQVGKEVFYINNDLVRILEN
jgi:Fic family protein